MKAASPELQALLATRQFFSADLYEIVLTGGGVLRYCGGDMDITWNGYNWFCGGNTGPFWDRKDNKAKCHWKVGVEVDSLVIDVVPGTSTVLGESFLAAIVQGVFDGAELTLYRAFMPTYGNVAAGTVIMFTGRVAEIDAGRSLATFTINSHLELLNQNMPRNLYQAGCANTLFDGSCGLSPGGFTFTGSAASGSGVSTIMTVLTPATGYFDLGVITFTSGANSGLSRAVQSWTNPGITGYAGTLNLIVPLPNIPQTGDSFSLTPGCDKQQSTCQNKFNNLINFRGFPYIPQNSTAV